MSSTIIQILGIVISFIGTLLSILITIDLFFRKSLLKAIKKLEETIWQNTITIEKNELALTSIKENCKNRHELIDKNMKELKDYSIAKEGIINEHNKDLGIIKNKLNIKD